jgi:hypothetical protein
MVKRTGFSTKGRGPREYKDLTAGQSSWFWIGAFVYYFTGHDGLGWHQGAAWIK